MAETAVHTVHGGVSSTNTTGRHHIVRLGGQQEKDSSPEEDPEAEPSTGRHSKAEI